MGEGEHVKKLFLFLAIIALFTGGITTTAFADGDDDDDDGDKKNDKKKDKTLEEICAKKKGFHKLICEAIFSIQLMLGMVKDDVAQLQEDVANIESTPGPQGATGPQGPPGKDGVDGLDAPVRDTHYLAGDWDVLGWDARDTNGLIMHDGFHTITTSGSSNNGLNAGEYVALYIKNNKSTPLKIETLRINHQEYDYSPQDRFYPNGAIQVSNGEFFIVTESPSSGAEPNTLNDLSGNGDIPAGATVTFIVKLSESYIDNESIRVDISDEPNPTEFQFISISAGHLQFSLN